LSDAPSPFGFSYFLDRILCFLSGLALNHTPSTYTSHIIAVIGLHYHAWLVCWGEGFTNDVFAQAGIELQYSPVSISPLAGLQL
jgi:hypothetical protein